jgi:hypothetical protein
MATTRDIQKFYHRLMELKDQGFTIAVEDNSHKDYVAYYISKRGNGNAEYKDCVIMNNGDDSDSDNEISVKDLLDQIESIVSTITEIFGK